MAYFLFNLTKGRAAKGKTLHEQAADLLRLKMWGIGAKAPNRGRLAPGDQVLIFVGAPTYEFIGSAELRSAMRDWTPSQAKRFPGSSDGGVLLRQAELWSHAVPMKSVLPQLVLSKTNPDGRFSAVVRITDDDYRAVFALGADGAATSDAAAPAMGLLPEAAAPAMGLPPEAVRLRLVPIVTDVLRGLVVLALAVLIAAAIFWLYFFFRPGP